MIESSDEMKRDFGKEWASLSKGVSLRATLSKIEQQETTFTEISVSHRTLSLISRVTSHELMGLTSRSDPKKTCRCSHETHMTRDSKGQETPLDSKFDRGASTHQRKKVQNQKKLFGGSQNKTPRPFVQGGQICKMMKLPGVYHQVRNSITPKTFCQRDS